MLDHFTGYEQILPIVDAYMAEHWEEVEWGDSQGVFCLGPTEEMIEHLMPAVYERLVGSQSDRCVILDTSKIIEIDHILQSHSSWVEPNLHKGTVLWLAPPGFDLERDSLKGHPGLTNELIENLPLNLLLSRFISPGSYIPLSICYVLNSSLHDLRVISSLKDLHSSIPPHGGADGHYRESVSDNWESLRWRSSEFSIDDALQINSKLDKCGVNQSSVPEFSCKITYPEESKSLCLMSMARPIQNQSIWTGMNVNIDKPDIPLSAVEARKVCKVLQGRLPRTEDSNRLFGNPVWKSGEWSPDSHPGPAQHGLEGLGYRMVPLENIANNLVEYTAENTPDYSMNNSIHIICKGSRFGSVFMESPDLNPGEHAIAISSDDPVFLAACLSSAPMKIYLKCVSFGTIQSPTISLLTLKRIALPWPSSTARTQWHQAVKSNFDTLAEIQTRLYDAAEELEYLLENLDDPRSQNRLVFASNESVRNAVIENGFGRHFEAKLKKILAENDNYEGRMLSGPRPINPPLPIALLRRKIDNSASDPERIWLATNLAEMIVRLDASACFLRLYQLDTKKSSLVFSTLNKQEVVYRFTFGNWKYIGNQSREAFEETVTDPTSASDRVLFRRSKRINKQISKLNAQRNDKFGHAMAPLPSQGATDSSKLTLQCDNLLNELAYLHSGMLFVTGAQKTTRKYVEIDRLVLNGLELEPEKQTLQVDQFDPHCKLVQGDVHLLVQNTPVSLWPFFVYTGLKNQPHKLWFVDEVQRDQITYRCVDGTSEKYSTVDGLDFFIDLFDW